MSKIRERRPDVFNIAAYLLESNLERGNGVKIALYDRDKTYTYSQLNSLVQRSAKLLTKLGLERENRVGIFILEDKEILLGNYISLLELIFIDLLIIIDSNFLADFARSRNTLAELRSLFATLAYFNITKQNVASEDPDDPFSVVATGEQESQGIELDVSGEISPGWKVIASYAYIDAEVTEDNVIEVGNRLFNAPEHSASLWTTYEIQQGNLQGLGFGVGFNFVGERQGDLENSFKLDSHFLTNAAVFYERNNWRAALNFRNLFDVDYIAGTSSIRERGNDRGEPFTVLGSISVEF